MAKNLRDQGYSSSMDLYNQTHKTTTGQAQNWTDRGGASSYNKSATRVNLRDQGYPDSANIRYVTPAGSVTTRQTSQTTPRTTSKKSTTSATNYPATYTETAEVPETSTAQYGGNYDILTGEPLNNGNAYYEMLMAYQKKQAEAREKQLAEMKAAAQAAYDRGVNTVNSAYANQLSSLSNNLNETKSQLENSFNRSRDNINIEAADALRQAYINKMLSNRNLTQQLNAMGINGGAAETTLARMLNNYGNARNQIQVNQGRNLSSLEGNYNDNLSQVMQAYNTAVANAEMQKAQQIMELENALANNQIAALSDYMGYSNSGDSDYYNILRSALANMQNSNS